MYNIMSPKAEEFISDEEIRECLEYAQKNKHNEALIDEITDKSRLSRNFMETGLLCSHRFICPITV